MVQSKDRIVYTPRRDATPESEAAVLATVYSFILRCAEERKKGGVPSTADDGKEIQDVPANPILPQQR